MTREQSNIIGDFVAAIKTEMPEAAALGDARLYDLVTRTLYAPAADDSAELRHTAAILQQLISIIRADLID